MTRRCTSPPTSPRWSATRPRVVHLDDGEMATVDRDRLHDVPRGPQPTDRSAPRSSTSTRRRTTRASTSPSCARRCSSSPRRPSGCCAAGSTSGSGPRTSAVWTWTPATCARSSGSRSSAAARRTTSARWAPSSSRSWPGSRRTPRRRASSATATRSSSRTPSTSRSASPARPSTPCSRCRRSGARAGGCIGLVNVVGSAIARECDGGIYLHAGPEVAVASTKALTTMYVGFALLALQLGRVRDLSIADGKRLVAGLQRLPDDLEKVLTLEPDLVQVAAAAGRGREPVLRRPGARLPGRPRGRAEVQGDHLPARRGLPDLRAQARAARADRQDASRPSRSSRTTSSPTATSARCTRSPPGAGRSSWSPTRASTSATSRTGCSRIDVPRNERELDPILLTVPAPAAGVPRGPAPGPRHRQAAQPREVGHRRVAAPAPRGDPAHRDDESSARSTDALPLAVSTSTDTSTEQFADSLGLADGVLAAVQAPATRRRRRSRRRRSRR